MSDAAVSLLILGAVVAVFVWNRLPVGIVALATALTLWATGLLSIGESLSGFGDPVVLFIAALFVVSEGLDASGVTSWVSEKLVSRVGTNARKLLVLVMLLSAVLTALITLNGAVAALLPVVVALALRIDMPPSRLLMPLAFAGSAGSLLLLTGTPVNVIVSDAASDAGAGGFAFFEFALVGIPLVIGTVLIVLILGRRVLPLRTSALVPPDLSGQAELLAREYGVTSEQEPELLTREYGVAEVVISPRSALVGDTVRPRTRTPGGLDILAVQRLGRDRGEQDTVLAVGDALLVKGTWEALNQNVTRPDVLVVDAPSLLRRTVPGLSSRGIRALAVVTAMVLLLAFGAVPPVVAGLLAAMAMILLQVVGVEQAHRAISWTTVVLIAGLIPLSTAISQSGAADLIAQVLVDVVGDGSPYLLLLAIFVLIGTLGQFVSNTATALIVIPVALAAAAELDVSVRPVLMCVTVAAAASFLTPIATPANMMVMGPAGYRFGDYWKLGLPIMVWFLVVGVLFVPLVWSFSP